MSFIEIGARIRAAAYSPARTPKTHGKSHAPTILQRARMSFERTAVYKELRAVFACYPEIFFIQNWMLGLAFFALTLAKPGAGAAGILAVLSAYGFARLTKIDREFLRLGFYTYNPLLVGLSLGNLLQFTPLTCFVVASAGILTFILAAAMANVFTIYLRLPILSLPFVLVSWCVHLAAHRYPNLLLVDVGVIRALFQDPVWPVWIAGFFKSIGAILFMPSVFEGMSVGILVLSQSRILFLLAALGFYMGAGVRALMAGSFDGACADVYNYNFILIAMAVGGVYAVPSIRSYVLAAIAVCISTIVLDASDAVCRTYKIPAFTLSFNLVSLAFIYMLELLQSPLYARFIGRTPEETVENEYTNRMRYVGQFRTLYLPFSGLWTVWQGFSGKWTHQGNWRFAYDFVITDAKGKTHANGGSKLEDYYCYKKPVLSPVRGRVVQAIDDLPDGEPGRADRSNNWGNLIVIQDHRGFFVEISHLAEKSLRVKVGDSVERGTVLGLCGNSGYSPQPHIHVQVQATETVGGASLPFSFVSYASEGKYHANECPAENKRIEPLYPDKRLDNLTAFVLDEVYDYTVSRNGQAQEKLSLRVKMAPDGVFYFDSGRGKLYFGKHEGTFYFYRVEGSDSRLRAMLLALPRLPLAYRPKLEWSDYAPVSAAARGLPRMLAQFLSSFYPRLAAVPIAQTFQDRSRIGCALNGPALFLSKEGPSGNAVVELGDTKGFELFKIGDVEIRRIEHEN